MTLLGEMALAFLIESVLLAGFWAASAGVAAAAVALLARRRPLRADVLGAPALGGFLTAMTVSSLAHRFGAPDLLLEIGRRRVPVLWSIGAAAAGAAAVAVYRHRAAAPA